MPTRQGWSTTLGPTSKMCFIKYLHLVHGATIPGGRKLGSVVIRLHGLAPRYILVLMTPAAQASTAGGLHERSRR